MLLAASLLLCSSALVPGALREPVRAALPTRSPPLSLMADVTVNFPGGRSATVPEGSPLSLAAYKAGAQITYQCKAGTCASCEVICGFGPVRTCQTTVKKPIFGSSITVKAKPGSATRL